MPKSGNDKVAFLLTEYEFMQKCYELQFNHFMAVFYFWIAVITVPVSASLISNLGTQDPEKPFVYGILCFLVAFIGFFLSLKMFDIRRSQLRYIQKLNEIRAYFSKLFDIEKKENLILLGKNSKGEIIDFNQEARTDFGRSMALIMSLVHGILVAVGLSLLFTYLQSTNGIPLQVVYILIGVLIGVVIFIINFYWYFSFFPKKADTSVS